MVDLSRRSILKGAAAAPAIAVGGVVAGRLQSLGETSFAPAKGFRCITSIDESPVATNTPRRFTEFHKWFQKFGLSFSQFRANNKRGVHCVDPDIACLHLPDGTKIRMQLQRLYDDYKAERLNRFTEEVSRYGFFEAW